MANLRGMLSFLKKEKRVSQSFLVNGGLLLEELIRTSNGRYRIPIRNFSVKDLVMATNNFDEHNHMVSDSYYKVYRGSLDGRLIVVKKFKIGKTSVAIRDIAITARMCVHKNVLKLVGCCLEDEALAIVYEHVGDTFLHECIYDGLGRDNRSLSWKCRLRAANEIASVVAYLHTALDRPVVHRNIKLANFIIDQHGVVKLYDFSLSISIPLGKSRVEDKVVGTVGFIDPEYLASRFVTEKSDVYSFGVLLLTLLSGRASGDHGDLGVVVKVKSCVENDQLNEFVDPKILGNGGEADDEQELQFHAFVALALKCTQKCGDDRPDIIQVAKELRRIERSIHLQVSISILLCLWSDLESISWR